MAAVARRQFCGKLHVITPQEVQWKPPLPQAAGTLAAMVDSAPSETKCGKTDKICAFREENDKMKIE